MRCGVVLAWQNVDWDRYESGDFSRPPEVPDWRVYEENRRLGDLVEPLGFDSLFVVEHHMTPHHMTGSGLQLLGYFAGRTARIDLGTCLIVLPWHHPVQVAEQISFLDNMLGGRRLWLGFGRGSAPVEFEGLAVEMGESSDRFREAAEVVRLALTQDCFSYEGTYYRFPQVTVRPRPRSSDLLDRFYGGVTTAPSLSAVARLGFKLMVIGGVKPFEESAADVRTFNAIRAETGGEPTRPIVVVWTYCARTQEEAWEGAQRYIGGYLLTSMKHYQLDDPEKFRGLKGYEHYARQAEQRKGVPRQAMAQAVARMSVWGTPQRCVEKIEWLSKNLHTDHMVFFMNMGFMPVDLAERSMRLFAEEVLPSVQKLEPGDF